MTVLARLQILSSNICIHSYIVVYIPRNPVFIMLSSWVGNL